MEIDNIKINETFRDLIPPLSNDEYHDLEESILSEGCREALTLWNDTIVDGHNRFEICKKHNLEFKTINKEFKNIEAVISWICTNQLGRRNISEETRRYLIGKRYEAEKHPNAHNATGRNQYSVKNEVKPNIWVEVDDEICDKNIESRRDTAKRLGNDYHISHATVDKYAAYTRAIDIIADACPELGKELLSGNVRMAHNYVIQLSKLPESEIQKCLKGIRVKQGSNSYASFTNSRNVANNQAITKDSDYDLLKNVGAIKKKPTYNPDNEINSLSYTIPSWIQTIERAIKNTDFSCVSTEALNKIIQSSSNLNNIVSKLILTARRNYNE